MIRIAPPYIVLLLVSLGFSVGVWFFVLPELQQLQTARGEIVSLGSSTSMITVSSKSTSQSAIDRAAERQTALLLVPSTDQQYDLAVQVESLTKTVGVTLTALSMTATTAATSGAATTTATPTPADSSSPATSSGTPAIPTGTQTVTLTLGITGSYAQITQFISELPTLNRYITINQLSVTDASSSPSSGGVSTSSSNQVSASITALAYYLPLPTNIAAQ